MLTEILELRAFWRPFSSHLAEKEQIGVAAFLEGVRRESSTISATANRYREEHVDVNNGHKNALSIRRVLRWCRTIVGFSYT